MQFGMPGFSVHGIFPGKNTCWKISRLQSLHGWPFPPPGDLPDPGIKPSSPASAGGFFTTETPEKPRHLLRVYLLLCSHYTCTHLCVLCCFSHVQLSVTVGTVARQAHLSRDSPGRNTEVDCHALLQGIFPTQGWNPHLLSPALTGGFFTTSATWEAYHIHQAIPN